jgi:hypothetical protein
LDTNNDGKISNQEINGWFKTNKEKLTMTFSKKLTKSFRILDGLTFFPVQFKTNGNEYFYSNRDLMKNYYDSVEFCKNWGGSLFKFSRDAMSKSITNSDQGFKRMYWYQTKNQINGKCMQFETGTNLLSQTSCNN